MLALGSLDPRQLQLLVCPDLLVHRLDHFRLPDRRVALGVAWQLDNVGQCGMLRLRNTAKYECNASGFPTICAFWFCLHPKATAARWLNWHLQMAAGTQHGRHSSYWYPRRNTRLTTASQLSAPKKKKMDVQLDVLHSGIVLLTSFIPIRLRFRWMAGHVLLLLAPAIRKDTEEVEVSVIVPDNTVKTEVKVL